MNARRERYTRQSIMNIETEQQRNTEGKDIQHERFPTTAVEDEPPQRVPMEPVEAMAFAQEYIQQLNEE